jgi:ABC-type multidrug transport system ATPase subunit
VTTILQAHGLRRDYDDVHALHSLDITFEAGEAVALIGANGAGKTTFLLLAAGLLDPSAGRVTIVGNKAGSLEARAALSFVPDSPALYDDLSLAEHLEYVARLHGVDAWEERGFELLERLGLADWADGLPRGFSRGMRQKASLALALVRPFRVLLADEPYDGLDPPSRDALAELLEEATEGGAAVIVSTHRAEVVEQADRCVALRDGSVVYDGPPSAAPLDW